MITLPCVIRFVICRGTIFRIRARKRTISRGSKRGVFIQSWSSGQALQCDLRSAKMTLSPFGNTAIESSRNPRLANPAIAILHLHWLRLERKPRGTEGWRGSQMGCQNLQSFWRTVKAPD
jgi:hypothetical protein